MVNPCCEKDLEKFVKKLIRKCVTEPVCDPRAVYKYTDAVPGMRWELWCGADAAPHGLIADIFGGTADGDHVNGAPSFTGTHPDNSWSDSQLNACGSGLAQVRAITWVRIPDGGGFLRDNNNNTGERAEVYFGRCCGINELVQVTDTNTNGANRSVLNPTAVQEGWIQVTVLLSDLSANGGFDLEFSADGTTWADINGRSNDLEIECLILDECGTDPGEEWSPCYPGNCTPPINIPVSQGLTAAEVTLIAAGLIAAENHPDPCTTPPTADNNNTATVGNALRQAVVGTDTDYARCDHKHPIVRQLNPGYQTFTVNGPGTLNATVNYGWGSDEETVTHRHRLQIDVAAGNGWVWFNVPTIPGFQRPWIKTLTTYRFTNGNPQQGANQLFGNMPDGPYMGSEAAEWTNIPRIYLGPFNHPTAARYYVHIVTENTRI